MHDYGFKPGEYVICRNGQECQIGKIKRLVADGAFVWYHEGETASKTPFGCLYKLTNGYTIGRLPWAARQRMTSRRSSPTARFSMWT